MNEFLEILKAIFFGIVEGITEWLPISSTGHIILADEFVKLKVSPEFMELFTVVIQLGAIAAVPVLFWNKLNPFSRKKSVVERKRIWNLWGKVCVGVLPAAVIGVLLDDFLDEHLYNYVVVAVALIVYGILFIIIERAYKSKTYRIENVDAISFKDAAVIGCFQALAIIPGTSRSGSTILGSRLIGISRSAAAEAGASLIKGLGFVDFVLETGISVPLSAYLILLTAAAVAFAVSMLAIRFLMDFVKKHSFAPFGVYRIVLGTLVVGWFLIR